MLDFGILSDRGWKTSFVVVVLLPAAVAGACRDEPEEPGSPAAAADPPAAAVAAPPAPAVAIRNARTPLPGVVSGGQPTEEQIEQAAAAGFRTVVNLRTPGEEGSWDEAPKVEELGMSYVSIPVGGVEDVTVDNARRLFEVLEDEVNHPVMVHCGSGNRVGALFALKAFHVDGKDAETAIEIGREAGLTRLEERIREMLEPPPP